MRVLTAGVALICVMVPGSLPAQVPIGGGTTVDFATVDEGRQILSSRDEFVKRLSPFDRGSRLKTDASVSEAQFLEFAGANVLPWTGDERERLTAVLQELGTRLAPLSLPLPAKVLLIKTTGREEGNAAYTRGDAVVLPVQMLTGPVPDPVQLICHELFHILSRDNPELRDRLYASIGFERCGEVELPEPWRSRRITNPDAPGNAHCILLEVNGEKQWAVPVLYSRTEKYDVQRGGEFFHYLEFRFLLVERHGAAARPLRDGRELRLVAVDEVSGLAEQIGRNTTYIVHPEEILADNFALLALAEQGLPSPEIVAGMRRVLAAHSSNASRDGHAGPAADGP